VTSAIILVPHVLHVARYADLCLTYCAERGYSVTGVVTDWAAASDLCLKGAADITVVARTEHLDPRRKPRLEVVGEQETRPQGPVYGTRQRRPRLI
jgi:hypothetical protein